jgi:predicted GNAT family N-acyltransferase
VIRTGGEPIEPNPLVHCRRIESVNDFIDAIRIRVAVFIQEQKCPPGWEPDEDDKSAEGFVAIRSGRIVGTARLIERELGALKIERMAVLAAHRRQGVGSALTEALVRRAHERGFSRLWMEAQSHAADLYHRCGFHRRSPEEYDPYDIGIPHVIMEYRSVTGSGKASLHGTVNAP